MVYEKEVILNIHHRIEMYEQEQLFNNNIPEDSNDMPAATFNSSHVHLGSCQHGLKFHRMSVSWRQN